MIFFARSEIARSMMSATAMMEAARRNQIGQPAACSIANNRLPYIFSDCARGLYGKEAPPRKLTRRSKHAPQVVRGLQDVVDFAISTKSCGQVCGLFMNSAHSPRQRGAWSWWRSKIEQIFGSPKHALSLKNQAPRVRGARASAPSA